MTDIFQADQPKQEEQNADQQTANTDQYKEYLEQITNEEGKPKYASVDEALKGAANAQEYIRKLQADLDALRAESDKGANVQDVMDAIKNQQNQGADQQSKTLGEEDVTAMFQNLLTKSKAEELQASNEAKFSEAVTRMYGDKASGFIAGKAKELGIETRFLQEMARTSPDAAMKLVGVSATPQSGGNLNGSSFNTVGQGGYQAPTRTYSMSGGSTKDLLAEWNRCKQIVDNR